VRFLCDSTAFLLLLLYNRQWFDFAVRDENGTVIWMQSCQPGEAAAEFMFGAFEYIKLATYSIVPFIIILTLNVAIVARLRHTTPLLLYARHGHSTTGDSIPLNRIGAMDSTMHVGERQMATAIRCESRQEIGLTTIVLLLCYY